MPNNDQITYFITSKDITDFRGLSYTDNSCYVDSVLISLFSPDNNHNVVSNFFLINIEEDNRLNICSTNANISKNIRKLLQTELQKIYLSINNLINFKVQNVDNLRKILKFCSYSENYGDNRMKDPAEFQSYILDMFNIVCTKKYTVYGVQSTNSLTKLSTNYDKFASPVITHILESEISLSNLTSQHEINTIDFTRNSKKFTKVLTVIELIDSPFIIFHIQRKSIRNNFNLTKIKPDEIIKLNNKKYKLSAVIVFNSNHYTTFFKKLNIWYYYDDLKNVLVKSHSKFQIESKGVLYYYYIV